MEPIERFFGDVASFLPRLTAVMLDDEAMRAVGFFEMVADLAADAHDGFVAAVQRTHAAGQDLVEALVSAVRQDYWPQTREALTTLLSRIASCDPWRDVALTALRPLDRAGSHHHALALRRLELSRFGIPEPLRWGELPLDFVPERFAGVDASGRREMLELVEHQLIHNERTPASSDLLDWVAAIAARGPDDARERAGEIHRERARLHSRPQPSSGVAPGERGPEW